MAPLRADAETNCDAAVTACEAEVLTLRDLVVKQEELATVYKRQRDEALELASKARTEVPWYLYVLVGAAGSIVLINTVRK